MVIVFHAERGKRYYTNSHLTILNFLGSRSQEKHNASSYPLKLMNSFINAQIY